VKPDEIIVDKFACGGGASEGIEWALGRPVDFALNHNAKALAVHLANHPRTVHLREDIRTLDPRSVGPGRPIGLGWFSPDCTYHSKARGGKPFRDRNRARRIRGLAWSVTHWVKVRRPRMFMLENVEEFAHWGPLLEDGKPDPKRRGQTFRRWHREIENLGYDIDMRELRACDYGAPTSRKRLFVIGRCDGREIVFPEAIHGPGLLPYRTAAECIDWSIPCPSIFLSREEGRKIGVKRPLADATLRRIARGVMRYVVNNPQPFIVPLTHHGVRRGHPIDEPLPTVTGANRGELALVSPTLINTRNGERLGQAPRVRDICEPYPTITAKGSQGALVTAFLARHYGGHENDGAPVQGPLFTVTTKDHHALVSSHVVKLKGTSRDGQSLDEPLHTIQAGGNHYGEVRAFLLKYYGNERDGNELADPLGTVTTKDRFALVMVHGEPYAIVDIGMRMLTPRELARATSFPDSYILDPEFNGKPLTKTDQVWMIGNAVPPVMSEALVSANDAAPVYRRASA
jgi:DNA (cytosine-5)-methyltransferase 1